MKPFEWMTVVGFLVVNSVVIVVWQEHEFITRTEAGTIKQFRDEQHVEEMTAIKDVHEEIKDLRNILTQPKVGNDKHGT